MASTSENPYQSPEADGQPPRPAGSWGGCLLKLFGLVLVIGLLIALFLPAVRSAPEAARRAQCSNNLKQIALALGNYESTYHFLPPAYTVDAKRKPLHSWRVLILPFLEQRALYDKIDLTKPWNDPANKEAYEATLAAYRCPSANCRPGHTTYLAIVGAGSCFLPAQPRRLSDITDGHDSTLMVIEVEAARQVHWMSPKDISEQELLALGPAAMRPHRGGAYAAFVDGSVHFISSETKATVLRALISINGNDGAALQGAF
jgi:prepilin-type processing-associated H-X9-DG protein